MPGMTLLPISEARKLKTDIIELKVDGSRITYKDGNIISDRDVNRNARYGHVLEELQEIDWIVRGEMAIPGGNILQLNKRENWHRAKFHIFDIYEFEGQDVTDLTPHEQHYLISSILNEYDFNHITQPRDFRTFDQGWEHVKKHGAEGLVLKTVEGVCWKVKMFKEEKLPIVGYAKGKTKGAFIIERHGVRSKVSGTSGDFVRAYNILQRQGKKAFVEIEYLFLTDDGIPYQPKLRRLGTLESLAVT